jgi:PAS domain S-box-containing protein
MTMPPLPDFAEVIEQAPDAIVLVEAQGSIVYANQRVTQLFGFAAADLVGQPVETLIPQRARTQHAAYRMTYSRTPKVRPMGDARLALAGRHADGSEFPVDVHLAPIARGGGSWTLAIIRDATERYRSQDELRQARQLAEKTERIKGEFLAIAAHDLAQPQQTLELVIGVMARIGPRDVAELAAEASASLALMRELLKMLLEISRLESGTLQVITEPISVNDICSDLERQFGPVARSRGLRFTVEPCPNIVETDPTLLRSMLSNIVSNAIRYTPAGEVRVRCAAFDDGSVRLAVHDTGIGIPGDRQQAIFEDFNRLEEARRIHADGFGLGLGIVRRLSGLLGFAVSVDSTPGRGSTFQTHIPANKVYRIR